MPSNVPTLAESFTSDQLLAAVRGLLQADTDLPATVPAGR
jgi:hypothetical protein